MTLEIEILQYLSAQKGKKVHNYKGIRTGFLGLPDFKYYKYQTLANKFSSLRTNGYIKEINGTYFITFKGEDYLNKKLKNYLKQFSPNKSETDPKNLLLLYDIPQDKTSQRNWFRRELIKFHFIMIQKSVWVGPSPLPQEFSDYIKEIGLEDSIKTFKLEKGYKTEK